MEGDGGGVRREAFLCLDGDDVDDNDDDYDDDGNDGGQRVRRVQKGRWWSREGFVGGEATRK